MTHDTLTGIKMVICCVSCGHCSHCHEPRTGPSPAAQLSHSVPHHQDLNWYFRQVLCIKSLLIKIAVCMLIMLLLCSFITDIVQNFASLNSICWLRVVAISFYCKTLVYQQYLSYTCNAFLKIPENSFVYLKILLLISIISYLRNCYLISCHLRTYLVTPILYWTWQLRPWPGMWPNIASPYYYIWSSALTSHTNNNIKNDTTCYGHDMSHCVYRSWLKLRSWCINDQLVVTWKI